jgi:hypothetical protein
MWQIYADGLAWIDSDGRDTWPTWEANALADHVESLGYEVEMLPA